MEELKAEGVALEVIDKPVLNTDTAQGSSCSRCWLPSRSWGARASVHVRPRVLPLPHGLVSTTGSGSLQRNRSSWHISGLPRACSDPKWLGILASGGRPRYAALNGSRKYVQVS